MSGLPSYRKPLTSFARRLRKGSMRHGGLLCAIGLSVCRPRQPARRPFLQALSPDAARPYEERAVRGCHLHQGASARCSRRAADVVRRPGARHRRVRSRVSRRRRDPPIRSCRCVDWSQPAARSITASSTTSAAEAPTRGWWRSFIGRQPRPEFEWGGHARGRLATIDEVRNAVLSGMVKGPVKLW